MGAMKIAALPASAHFAFDAAERGFLRKEAETISVSREKRKGFFTDAKPYLLGSKKESASLSL